MSACSSGKGPKRPKPAAAAAAAAAASAPPPKVPRRATPAPAPAPAPAPKPTPTPKPRTRPTHTPTPAPAPAPDEAARDVVERTLLAADDRVKAAQRRIRKADAAARAGRGRRPVGDSLFHEPDDVLAAAVSAIVALVGPQSKPPAWMNITSSPRFVYRWVVEQLICFGDEMRAEGAALRADVEAPRCPPEHAVEALRLMQTLQALLTPRLADEGNNALLRATAP